MPRIDDLVDLTQMANDIYLVNPSRNVRMAYIQIDDLCELAMKTWLQLNVPNWSPVSHQRNGRDYFKGFRMIIDEVKQQNPSNHALSDILDHFDSRRDNRNRFFHDQSFSGLTVTEDECLRAFCDFYDLLIILFGNDCQDILAANRIASVQMAVIRLKLKSCAGGRRVLEYYQDAAYSPGDLRLRPNSLGYEYCVIYDNPEGLHDRVSRHFNRLISENREEIERIDRLTRRTRDHHLKQEKLADEIAKLEAVVDECLS